MPNEIMITMPMERYEQLLDTETRTNVAVERIINDPYINNEDILRILGTEDAICEAGRIRKKREERRRMEEAARKEAEEKEPGHEL